MPELIESVVPPTNYNMMSPDNSAGVFSDIVEEANTAVWELQKWRRIRAIQELFIYAYGRTIGNRKEIQAARKAYFSDGWDSAVKSQRDSENLPIANDNIFATKVDTLVGIEQSARRDIRFSPTERDDERSVDFFNLLYKHTTKVNTDYYHDVHTMFRNGVMMTRAHREWVWDFEHDYLGELKAVYHPANDIIVDPDSTSYDKTMDTDAKYRFHYYWTTPREIQNTWKLTNDQWRRLQVGLGENDTLDYVQVEGIDDNVLFPSSSHPHLFWKDRQFVRVLRCWKYDSKTIIRVLDKNALTPTDVFVGDFMSEDEVENVRIRLELGGLDTRGWELQRMKVRRTSYHVISGNVELEFKEDIGAFWPWDDFHAIHIDGHIAGMWNRLKDPQLWINFISAKLLERVGRIGHQPMFIEDGVAKDPVDLSRMWQDGQPIILNEGALTQSAQKPFHIERDHSLESVGPLLNWVQFFSTRGDSASGLSAVNQGTAPGSVRAASGIAILQQEGRNNLSSYSANMLYTRVISAYLRLQLFLQRYKESPSLVKMKLQRVFGSALDDGENIELEQFVVGKIANDDPIDLDKLILRIQTQKYDATEDANGNDALNRAQKIQELQYLQGNGIAIPPETLVRLTTTLSPREKEEILKGIQQDRQLRAQLAGSPEIARLQEIEAAIGNSGAARGQNTGLPTSGNTDDDGNKNPNQGLGL